MNQMNFLKFALIVFVSVILIACGQDATNQNTEETENEEVEETESGGNESEDTETEETEGQGGELKIAYSAQPAELDPQTSVTFATTDVMRYVFETLVAYDSDFKVQPMLADSWEESDDGKEITFYLREGITFHNGKEMLAEDVAASMNRWVELPGSRGNFADAVFEVIDDYTVVLNLQEPLSVALSTMAHAGGGAPAIMPKDIIEEAGVDGQIDEFIGTGPYEFVEWKQDQHVHLTRYDDYQSRTEPASGLAGERKALVDDIYFMFVPDASTRVAGVQTGDYDVIHATPYDNVDQLENDPSLKTYAHTGGMLYLYFNKKKGLFADQTARQAIAPALDFADISHGVYGNDEFYTLGHSMMMEEQVQWSSDVGKEKYEEYDPEKSKQMLEEIGYDGEEVTLITSRDYIEMYNAAIVIQKQLEEIGINVNLEVYDWAAFLDLYRDDPDAWDILTLLNTMVPDPASLESLEQGWIDSPELDDLLLDFRSRPSLDEAMSLYDDIQEWYWDYVPVIKISDYNRIATVRESVENIQFQEGFILWNVTNNK